VDVPILHSWSGGKDSCLALAEVRADASQSAAVLLTTVTEGYDRVSMHGVRRALIHRQADALGLPVHIVTIPQHAGNRAYESRMEAAFERFRLEGMTTIAFGDLFLADIRRYREEWLARTGMTPVSPRPMRRLLRNRSRCRQSRRRPQPGPPTRSPAPPRPGPAQCPGAARPRWPRELPGPRGRPPPAPWRPRSRAMRR